MESRSDIPVVARALANRSRTAMLDLLLDGRSHAAADLAHQARIPPSSASGHLAVLAEAGLVAAHRSGRQHRYRLAGPEVARALEALAAVAPPEVAAPRRSPGEAERLRQGRTCYDHLAGRLGVAVTEGLVSRRALRRQENAFTLTRLGTDLLEGLGVDVRHARTRKRAFALACLDWTEKRSHLGGALGAAVCDRFFALGWVRRVGSGRAAALTNEGAASLASIMENGQARVKPTYR
jgi:DNA-binding transcriptional ArsR family regulator